MEADQTNAYDQGDATGFIQLNAPRLKLAAKVEKPLFMINAPHPTHARQGQKRSTLEVNETGQAGVVAFLTPFDRVHR